LAASRLRHQNQRKRNRLLRLLLRLRLRLKLLRRLQRSQLKLLRQHISKIVNKSGDREFFLSPDLLFGKETGNIFS
jgi:hypothetical protein